MPALSEAELRALKREVLQRQVLTLTNDLGPPERYFPALTTEGLLKLADRQSIEHKVTTQEKVQLLADLLSENRKGFDGRDAFDVLVDVLRKGHVHASVAAGLEEALEKAAREASRNKGISPSRCVYYCYKTTTIGLECKH